MNDVIADESQEGGDEPSVIFQILEELQCLFVFFGLKHDFKPLLDKVDSRTRNFLTKFPLIDSMLCEKPTLKYDGKALTPKVFGIMRLQYERGLNKRCMWLPCQFKNRIEHEKIYRCKGCNLIRYCSPKCQKKHWKFIHSQQCKEVRKLGKC